MNILCIADLHFGKIPNEKEMYESLKNNFIEYANKCKPEMIVICGDSYDSRVLINSNANIYFNKFIDDCRSTGAVILVIGGTESHERYQINALAHYVSDKFFIINTVTKLNICGLKCLILPEEYVKSDDYYDNYLNETYDFCFGHGLSSHVGFKVGGVSDEIVKKPYVWEAKKLEKMIKYYTVFGHIHTHSEYHKFIYCGSYSRLNFGEMEEKGFIHLILNKNKCDWKFVVNKDAPKFTDIYESKLPDDVENLIKNLRGYQENNDYLRIVIDQEDDNKYNTIKGFVLSHPNCCIKRIAKQEQQRIKEISDNIKEKQRILHDKMKEYNGLDLIEITRKIAKSEYHVDFTVEDINNILNSQL